MAHVPQRVADHEAGHFVCMKSQFPDRYRTFEISILPGKEFTDWDWSEILGQPHEEKPSPLLIIPTSLGGIAAEAIGFYLDEVGKRDSGIDEAEFDSVIDRLFVTMEEFTRTGGGAKDILDLGIQLNAVHKAMGMAYEDVPKPFSLFKKKDDVVRTLDRVWRCWKWNLQISKALLIHGTITNHTYEALVGPMPTREEIEALLA